MLSRPLLFIPLIHQAMKKKLIHAFALVFLSIGAAGQIPNYSFENWTNIGSYEVPDQWGTLNNTTSTLGVYTVTKATPGNPGSSYMKITSKTAGPGVAPGIAVSGVLDSITMQPKSGFQFYQRPANFTGKWQHMIFGSSQGSISVKLTKWDTVNGMRETVAVANLTLSGMAMSWANFSIPFTYQTGNNPDTCIIVLKASGVNPTDQDYLWVDNLGFSGSVVGINDEASSNSIVSAFPNPAASLLTIDIALSTPQNTVIEITDVAGRVVLTHSAGVLTGDSRQTIDISGLAKGMYVLRVTTDMAMCTENIIVR